MGKICESCANIPTALFADISEGFGPYTFISSIDELRASAEAGCEICQAIQEYLVDSPSYILGNHDSRCVYLQKGQEINIGLKLEGSHLSSHVRDLIRCRVESISGTAVGKQGFRSHQPITPCNDSDRTFEIASAWLQECKTSHRKCRARWAEARLPGRLVHVGIGGSTQPKLILTKNLLLQDTTYLCLSYCWGEVFEAQAVTTKVANLQQRLQSIDTKELSKTLQDALIITQKLGYKYIWIDALCICQDSKEDWQRESALMALIYSNADCMIAAVDAKDSSEGCFRVRPESLTKRVTLLEDAVSGIRVTLAPPKPLFNSSVRTLDHRGWCLQEHILARRVISFTAGEITWECEQAKAHESGPWPSHNFNEMQANPERVNEHSHYNKWLNLVEDYSARQLTFATDRLPAISGLVSHLILNRPHANSLQPSFPHNETYLAGVFRGDLMRRSLFWTKDYSTPTALKRPKDYIAPSWSWASVTGAINFEVETNIEIFEPRLDNLRSERGRWTPLLADTEIVLASEDPHGQVKGGTITLQGVMKQVYNGGIMEEGDIKPPILFVWQQNWHGENCKQNLLHQPRYSLRHPETDELVAQVYFDDAADSVENTLYVLRWAKYGLNWVQGGQCFAVIVLAKVLDRRERRFRRVGVGATEDGIWLDEIDEKEIVVV